MRIGTRLAISVTTLLALAVVILAAVAYAGTRQAENTARELHRQGLKLKQLVDPYRNPTLPG